MHCTCNTSCHSQLIPGGLPHDDVIDVTQFSKNVELLPTGIGYTHEGALITTAKLLFPTWTLYTYLLNLYSTSVS